MLCSFYSSDMCFILFSNRAFGTYNWNHCDNDHDSYTKCGQTWKRIKGNPLASSSSNCRNGNFNYGTYAQPGNYQTNYAIHNSHQRDDDWKFHDCLRIVLNQMNREVGSSRDMIDALLALGATPKQAIQQALQRSVKASMIPTIDGMKTVGLVQLPGMMTGMIIAGRVRSKRLGIRS